MKRNKQPLLSVVIPAFNEEKTIETIINQVLKSGVKNQEIIVVDDCSRDNTRLILKKLFKAKKIDQLILKKENGGKGSALKIGFKKAKGKIIIIQDADLEYDPKEYPEIIRPIIERDADVVYGSRFVGSKPHRVVYFWHSIANRWLTLLSNFATNLNLTDMETCYKAFKSEVLQKIDIEEKSFGIEPELTAKIAKLNCKIYEVGISYHGRTYEEGKKIGFKDAIWALWAIQKYNYIK